MTNEEAIKILYSIRAYYASLTAGYPSHDCYGLGDMKCSDICKALLRGISLLKQEPKTDTWSIKEVADALEEHGLIREQEPCEDAIDRAEAMTVIMMFAGNVKLDEENIYIKVLDTVQLLRDLPSVTPQPKTGHWHDKKNENKRRSRLCLW